MKRLIGYGTTNSSGVATLTNAPDGSTLSPNGYTGKGVGKIDIQAELHDDSIIQSEIYDVLDCIFYDDGLSGTNTKWDMVVVTKSLESNGTKFLCTSTSASARASMNPYDNSSVYDFPPQPMAFECDLVDFSNPSGTIGMQFIQSGGANKVFNFSSDDIGHTIKVEYDGTKLTKYIDGVAQANPQTVTYTGDMRVGFSLYAKDGYIIVKDVKAYPI